jgi:hypothetical protein
MEEWLLFYRIKCDASGISERNKESAVPVKANLTDAVFPRRNFAAMPAGITLHPRIRQRCVQFSLPSMIRQYVFQILVFHNTYIKVASLMTDVKPCEK